MNGAAEDGSSPYVPVDPFKPSIAFSLNNVIPQRQPRHNRVAQPSSLHQPPQRAHLPGRRGPYQRGRYGYGHGHYQRPAPFPYPYPYPPNAEVNYHAPGPIYPERRYEASRSPQLRGRSPTRRVVEEERADGTSARSQSSPGSHRPVYLPPTHTGIAEPVLDSRLPQYHLPWNRQSFPLLLQVSLCPPLLSAPLHSRLNYHLKPALFHMSPSLYLSIVLPQLS
ncbi:hypothetical protein CPB84DRAFT_1539784 [Gymnopilus junonius]|uniref:Uncharacterized protein n=1 Tax=Gymnopilus junonius TaxID=109634 RepID=A0A9P5NIA4_GYMJU|nr:hypothetical protein CPB84DRAFT_1539784 [Gymnopilus junonius]